MTMATSFGPCPICFESLANGDPISLSKPCGHLGHTKCFDKWKVQQQRVGGNVDGHDSLVVCPVSSVVCPVCKQPNANFDRIFVQMTKSCYMEELETECAKLRKTLTKTKKSLKASETMNQKLFAMAVRPFLRGYLGVLKQMDSGSVHSMDSILTAVEQELGLSLTEPMKQTVQEIVEASGLSSETLRDEKEETGTDEEDIVLVEDATPREIIVEGCGTTAANGAYHRDGLYDSSSNFSKNGTWDNRDGTFSIWKYQGWWFITFEPRGKTPGTGHFLYVAGGGVNPPLSGWSTRLGQLPAPSIRLVQT